MAKPFKGLTNLRGDSQNLLRSSYDYSSRGGALSRVGSLPVKLTFCP